MIYFDSAATTLICPDSVTALQNFWKDTAGASPFRGNYDLAKKTENAYWQSKKQIANFFGAERLEYLPLPGTTTAINVIASHWAGTHLKNGDKIILSLAEHHSNISPWQKLAQEKNLEILWLNFDRQTGQLDLKQLRIWLQDPQVRLLALAEISNVLGVLNPIADIALAVRKVNRQRQKLHLSPLRFLVDAAQSATYYVDNFAHSKIDFLAFSGHKIGGPTSSGGLLVRHELIKSGEFSPWLFGGGMVDQVTLAQTTPATDLEKKFQAGTPDVASLVGLSAVTQYLQKENRSQLRQKTISLTTLARTQLLQFPDIHFLVPNPDPQTLTHILAFTSDRYATADIATLANQAGFALREGFHCAQPLHDALGLTRGSLRLSFSSTNTPSEIEAFINFYAQKLPQILH